MKQKIARVLAPVMPFVQWIRTQYVLVEILHIAAGMALAVLIAELAIWSYPPAKSDIHIILVGVLIAIAAMGIGPVRRGIGLDRARRAAARPEHV